MKIKKQSSSRLLPVTLLVVAVGLLMGSCKKETKDDGKGGLRAVMVDFAHSGQKAYIDPEHYSCFQSGEKVRVNATTNQVTPLIDYKNRRCKIGEVPSTDNYYAVYPADMLVDKNVNLSSGFGGTPIAMEVPNEQTWSIDNDGNQVLNNPMLSYEQQMIDGYKTLLFRNLCALWKISVSTRKDFNKIKITIPGCVMAGKGNIVMSGTGGHFPKLVVDRDTSHSVTLDLGTTHHGTAWGEGFYIVVPELTVPTGSTVYVEFLNGSTSVKKFKLTNRGSDMLFEANKIHTLANFNFYLGLFSVSPTQKVVFAPGNLQWSISALASTHSTSTTANGSYNRGTFRFAEHQYDIIGADNKLATDNFSANYMSNYTGWVDLFTWGGSGYKGSRPFGNLDYWIDFEDSSKLGDFDWGAYNTIYNPQTKVNDPFGTTWRTLTADEWDYLLRIRGQNDGWCRYSIVHFTVSQGNTAYGYLVYPDSTTFDTVKTFIPDINPIDVNANSRIELTKSQYDQLEAFGCAFFPDAGYIKRTSMWNNTYDPANGYYWTSSASVGPGYAYPYYMRLTDGGYSPESKTKVLTQYLNVYYCSVRLAHDVK